MNIISLVATDSGPFGQHKHVTSTGVLLQTDHPHPGVDVRVYYVPERGRSGNVSTVAD